MAIVDYRDFEITFRPGSPAPGGDQDYEVQVLRSPAGEGPGERVVLQEALWRQLNRLDRRSLSVPEIIDFGSELAGLMLPEGARRLFLRSLERLDRDQGLRLRLRLEHALSQLPWEFAYVARGLGELDVTGFLGLDPRLSLVRHEALPLTGDLDTSPRTRRLLVALASPESERFEQLDLARERRNLELALDKVAGIDSVYLEGATAQTLEEALLPGADIFHFAGHGEFAVSGLGERLGSMVGAGSIVLETSDGGAAEIPADQLAVNLRGQNVELVVLGACQSGRRDGENIWSGVAAALMRAGIPVVIAMQFKIWDDAAIAFSRGLYQGLAGGLLLDQAVAAGRLAAFNVVHPLRADPDRGRFWQDWGAPVVYYRAEQEFRLPAFEGVQAEANAIRSLETRPEAFLQEVRPMTEEPKSGRTINTGGGAYIEGSVTTGGGDFVGRDQYKSSGLSAQEVEKLFAPIFSALATKEELDPLDRADLETDVTDLQAEVVKGDEADESFIARRLRNIQRVAPDILDVVLATLGNPAAGFALAVRKVAERMGE